MGMILLFENKIMILSQIMILKMKIVIYDFV